MLFGFVLAASGQWSSNISRLISSPLIEYATIANYAVSSEEGPVYSEENISNRFPDWAREMEGFPTEEQNKKSNYLVELIQVDTGNPNAVVE